MSTVVNKSTRFGLSGVASIFVLAVALQAWVSGPVPADEVEPFAVVELFTSEGCSSCPPADNVVADILARRGAFRGTSREGSVYVLAWHVDYWDYLGWPDPFGSAFASERQRRYARAGSGGVYTPQIVVNGRFVAPYAGNARGVAGTIAAGLAETEEATTASHSVQGVPSISIGPAVPRDGTLQVQYQTERLPDNAEVVIVVVERGLVRDITAGENRGKTLHHENVARAFARSSDPLGAVELELPADTNTENSSVIAFVQTRNGTRIHAASERPVSGSPASVSGSIRMPDDGNAGIRNVLACSDYLCVPGRSDETGAFTITGIPAGEYTLRVGSVDAREGVRVSLASGETLRLRAPLIATE